MSSATARDWTTDPQNASSNQRDLRDPLTIDISRLIAPIFSCTREEVQEFLALTLSNVIRSVVSHQLYTFGLIPLPLDQLNAAAFDIEQSHLQQSTRFSTADRRLCNFADECSTVLESLNGLIAQATSLQLRDRVFPIQSIAMMLGASIHNARRLVHIDIVNSLMSTSDTTVSDRFSESTRSQILNRISRCTIHALIAHDANEPLQSSMHQCKVFLGCELRSTELQIPQDFQCHPAFAFRPSSRLQSVHKIRIILSDAPAQMDSEDNNHLSHWVWQRKGIKSL